MDPGYDTFRRGKVEGVYIGARREEGGVVCSPKDYGYLGGRKWDTNVECFFAFLLKIYE